MKTKIGILVLALSTSFFGVQAQRTVTTTRATSNEISDNLNLDAVASIFGDSENLEDFERRLNDPENKISNLDLNEDGYIDYLRVVENSSDENSLVVIQAVLDQDVYQDVATIEVERVSNRNPRVQIVGDPFIYGSNYIIEPYFASTPLIFSFFWGTHYRPWISPYYWNYYPRWYSHYRPCSPYKYRRHVYAHINFDNKYHRTENRNIHFSGDNYNHIRRNDFATRYPDRAFENRHRDVENRDELVRRRSDRSGEYRSGNNVDRSANRYGSENQNRRPSNELKSGSDRNQPREYRGNSNINRTENNIQERPRVEYRNDTPNQRTAPERVERRAEPTQRNTAPRERSVSNNSRSNSEVKQARRSEQRSETKSREDKKESENGRRR